MSSLLIEIGNTALKAAWSEGGVLGKTVRYQGEKVTEFITRLLIGKERPELVVMASVRDISAHDLDEIRSRCGQLVLLDSSNPAILKAYGLPEYLSPDRAASLVAARKLFRDKACMVVDFGTTLSVDFIGEDGSYQGGNISLGCRTRFKALNRYSRNLPLVNTPSEFSRIGDSVVSAMESGVISGIKFEIDGYIASARQSVVVFTGGDAEYFSKLAGSSVFVVNNLVLMGLATIAEDYE